MQDYVTASSSNIPFPDGYLMTLFNHLTRLIMFAIMIKTIKNAKPNNILFIFFENLCLFIHYYEFLFKDFQFKVILSTKGHSELFVRRNKST